jgi:hypothetical protein
MSRALLKCEALPCLQCRLILLRQAFVCLRCLIALHNECQALPGTVCKPSAYESLSWLPACRNRPPQGHGRRAPALHIAAHPAHGPHHVFDDVGARQRSSQLARQSEPDHREDLVQSFEQAPQLDYGRSTTITAWLEGITDTQAAGIHEFCTTIARAQAAHNSYNAIVLHTNNPLKKLMIFTPLTYPAPLLRVSSHGQGYEEPTQKPRVSRLYGHFQREALASRLILLFSILSRVADASLA